MNDRERAHLQRLSKRLHEHDYGLAMSYVQAGEWNSFQVIREEEHPERLKMLYFRALASSVLFVSDETDATPKEVAAIAGSIAENHKDDPRVTEYE